MLLLGQLMLYFRIFVFRTSLKVLFFHSEMCSECLQFHLPSLVFLQRTADGIITQTFFSLNLNIASLNGSHFSSIFNGSFSAVWESGMLHRRCWVALCCTAPSCICFLRGVSNTSAADTNAALQFCLR